MRDLQAVINKTQNDAAEAVNAISDVVDYLAVLGMAMAYEEGVDPFSQIGTVLDGAATKAKEAAAAARRACEALSEEMRF